MNPHFAAAEKKPDYGITNETEEVKELIAAFETLQKIQDRTGIDLQSSLDAIADELEANGVPTWEKYQEDSEFWDEILMEVLDDRHGVRNGYVDAKGNMV